MLCRNTVFCLLICNVLDKAFLISRISPVTRFPGPRNGFLSVALTAMVSPGNTDVCSSHMNAKTYHQTPPCPVQQPTGHSAAPPISSTQPHSASPPRPTPASSSQTPPNPSPSRRPRQTSSIHPSRPQSPAFQRPPRRQRTPPAPPTASPS